MHDLLGIITLLLFRRKIPKIFLGQFSSQNSGIVAKQTYGNIPKGKFFKSRFNGFC